MAYLDGYYLNNPHVSQFDGSVYASSNCTPASVANGINAVTGGRVKRTGAQIRRLVPRSEETNPTLPGWSLEDAKLALSRLYPPMPLTIRTGRGWSALMNDLDAGNYLLVQGDEDVFKTGCASTFDGPHCIGLHPAIEGIKAYNNNPLCPTGGFVDLSLVRAYAMKLNPTIFYASMGEVPREPVREDGDGDVSISTTGLTLTSDYAVTLPRGTPIYEAPENGARILGRATGPVSYFGTPATGWKAVRVTLGGGSKIAYTTTAAVAYKV